MNANNKETKNTNDNLVFYDMQGNITKTCSNNTAIPTSNINTEKEEYTNSKFEKYLKKGIKFLIILIVIGFTFNLSSIYLIKHKESKLSQHLTETKEYFNSAVDNIDKFSMLVSTLKDNLNGNDFTSDSNSTTSDDFKSIVNDVLTNEDTFEKILNDDFTEQDIGVILEDENLNSDLNISNEEIKGYIKIIEDFFADVNFNEINSLDDIYKIAEDMINKRYDRLDAILE